MSKRASEDILHDLIKFLVPAKAEKARESSRRSGAKRDAGSSAQDDAKAKEKEQSFISWSEVNTMRERFGRFLDSCELAAEDALNEFESRHEGFNVYRMSARSRSSCVVSFGRGFCIVGEGPSQREADEEAVRVSLCSDWLRFLRFSTNPLSLIDLSRKGAASTGSSAVRNKAPEPLVKVARPRPKKGILGDVPTDRPVGPSRDEIPDKRSSKNAAGDPVRQPLFGECGSRPWQTSIPSLSDFSPDTYSGFPQKERHGPTAGGQDFEVRKNRFSDLEIPKDRSSDFVVPKAPRRGGLLGEVPLDGSSRGHFYDVSRTQEMSPPPPLPSLNAGLTPLFETASAKNAKAVSPPSPLPNMPTSSPLFERQDLNGERRRLNSGPLISPGDAFAEPANAHAQRGRYNATDMWQGQPSFDRDRPLTPRAADQRNQPLLTARPADDGRRRSRWGEDASSNGHEDHKSSSCFGEPTKRMSIFDDPIEVGADAEREAHGNFESPQRRSIFEDVSFGTPNSEPQSFLPASQKRKSILDDPVPGGQFHGNPGSFENPRNRSRFDIVDSRRDNFASPTFVPEQTRRMSIFDDPIPVSPSQELTTPTPRKRSILGNPAQMYNQDAANNFAQSSIPDPTFDPRPAMAPPQVPLFPPVGGAARKPILGTTPSNHGEERGSFQPVLDRFQNEEQHRGFQGQRDFYGNGQNTPSLTDNMGFDRRQEHASNSIDRYHPGSDRSERFGSSRVSLFPPQSETVQMAPPPPASRQGILGDNPLLQPPTPDPFARPMGREERRRFEMEQEGMGSEPPGRSVRGAGLLGSAPMQRGFYG